jgi:glycosyltransferase involved in cell wall biosynthesis
MRSSPSPLSGALPNERLSAAFADHDIFLHAAEEGAVASAGSLLAALAHGIPVVAVRTERDEACFARGVVFAQANPEQIARKCAKLLQQPARLEQFASASRLLYDAAFGWSRMVNTIDVALLQRQHQAAV